MKTLAKYYVCNHCVMGEKTFKNILIGPDKFPELSRNGPQPGYGLRHRYTGIPANRAEVFTCSHVHRNGNFSGQNPALTFLIENSIKLMESEKKKKKSQK